MSYNYNFWVSGVQSKCPGKLKWCGDDIMMDADVNWGANYPSNYQNNDWCVMQVYKGAANVTFATKPCKTVDYFLCEVKFNLIVVSLVYCIIIITTML